MTVQNRLLMCSKIWVSWRQNKSTLALFVVYWKLHRSSFRSNSFSIRQTKLKTIALLLMSIDNLMESSSFVSKSRSVKTSTHTVCIPTMDTSPLVLFPFRIDQSETGLVSVTAIAWKEEKRRQSTLCAEIIEDKEKQIIENHSNLLQKITFRSSFFHSHWKKRRRRRPGWNQRCFVCLLLHIQAKMFLHVVMRFQLRSVINCLNVTLEVCSLLDDSSLR